MKLSRNEYALLVLSIIRSISVEQEVSMSRYTKRMRKSKRQKKTNVIKSSSVRLYGSACFIDNIWIRNWSSWDENIWKQTPFSMSPLKTVSLRESKKGGSESIHSLQVGLFFHSDAKQALLCIYSISSELFMLNVFTYQHFGAYNRRFVLFFC